MKVWKGYGGGEGVKLPKYFKKSPADVATTFKLLDRDARGKKLRGEQWQPVQWLRGNGTFSSPVR
jgi:hypothetical protein